MDYPWYIKLEKSTDLQQGDLIENCPVIVTPAVLKKETGRLNEGAKERLYDRETERLCDREIERLYEGATVR